MFEITLNGKTLYHPNSSECNITNGVIHEALNDAGYMDVTIPFSNPMYSEIQERNGEIIVYKDNVEYWYGEVRDVSVDFSKNKSMYIVGEAAYLNDTVQPQRKISGTKYQVLQQLINQHNAMCGSKKTFQIGVVGNNANKKIEIVTDWEYTLDAIREHICEDEEYFRIRHVNGVRYIDIMPLESYGKRSNQDILFGDNLLDYVEESSGEKIATICIPLGATKEEGGIEDYENYITCEDSEYKKNYVELPGAINRLGRITRVVHFNVLTEPKALRSAALNYLQSAQYARLTLKLTAVDLSILHNDIDGYSVGDYARAICEPMGMNAWFPVRERETDILNLANNNMTIGAEGTKSFTKQSAESIDDLTEIMPKKDSILNAALKNASALINSNGTNGNVSIRTDANGKPYEILIMNADSIEASTQAWRWNLQGFGFGTKEANAKDFTWKAQVAITMDGSIVAGAITSGILKLGGKGATLEIYDGDTLIGSWDSTGIKINKGSINLGAYEVIDSKGNKSTKYKFQVTNEGALTAESADIKGTVNATAGSFAGFTMHTEEIIDGVRWNYMSSKNDKVRIGCRADGTVGAIWINGNTVPTFEALEDLATNEKVNLVSAAINSTNEYVGTVNEALSKRCDGLNEYITSVHNLVKSLHGLE